MKPESTPLLSGFFCASVLHTDTVLNVRMVGRSASGAVPDTAVNYWSGEGVSQRLHALYAQNRDLPGFASAFSFVPSQLLGANEEWEGPGEWITATPIPYFDFSKSYKNTTALWVGLKDPVMHAHIFECKTDDLSVLNVWLSLLTSVPLEALLRLRVDEEDAFSRFSYALRKLVIGAGDVDAETKAKEIFQAVDYEVRQFEARMAVVIQQRWAQALQASLGIATMGLTFTLSSEVAKILCAAIGAYQGKDFVGYLFRDRNRIRELRSSDFFLPWLCTRLR
jgi:hypothetical protein